MTYGIPTSVFPVSHDEKILVKNHLEMLKCRETMEDYMKGGNAVTMVEIPSNDDVLLGKGCLIQQHMGNVKLHFLVDQKLPSYDSCKRKLDKMNLSQDIVDEVKARSGRFLTQESGVWTEVSDDIARIKIGHLFRNRRKVMKKQANLIPAADGNREKGTRDGVVSDESPFLPVPEAHILRQIVPQP